MRNLFEFPVDFSHSILKFSFDKGLNTYAHAFLMPSGKMFLQANWSTTLWDYNTNVEEKLPDMPDRIIRIYPASGATAMLPLTPENNYTRKSKLILSKRSRTFELELTGLVFRAHLLFSQLRFSSVVEQTVSRKLSGDGMVS